MSTTVMTPEDLTIPDGPPIEMIVLGILGAGKSATLNSILGEKLFVSRSGRRAVTTECRREDRRRDDRTVIAVDLPGYHDVEDENGRVQLSTLLDEMRKCLTLLPNKPGPNVILCVVSFLNRTDKRRDKVQDFWLKLIGREVLATNGVMVVTHGDTYKIECREDGVQPNIKEMLNSPDAYIKDKELFDMCGRRCVCFNNRATDVVEMKRQLRDLVLEIDSMQIDGELKNVTPQAFIDSALIDRAFLATKSTLSQLRSFSGRISLLMQSIENANLEKPCLFRNLKAEAKGIKDDLTLEETKDASKLINEKFGVFYGEVAALSKLINLGYTISSNHSNQFKEDSIRALETMKKGLDKAANSKLDSRMKYEDRLKLFKTLGMVSIGAGLACGGITLVSCGGAAVAASAVLVDGAAMLASGSGFFGAGLLGAGGGFFNYHKEGKIEKEKMDKFKNFPSSVEMKKI